MLVERAFNIVNGIYINVFLLALKRKYDLKKAIQETKEECKNFLGAHENELKKGEYGLVFLELLCRKIGSSLAEALTMREDEKEEIIHWIIGQAQQDKHTILEYDEDDNQIIEFHTLIRVMSAKEEGNLAEFYRNLLADNLNSSIYTFYPVSFARYETKKGFTYGVSIDCNDKSWPLNDDTFDYVYASAEIWVEKEGKLADYIESVIIEKQEGKVAEETVKLPITEAADTKLAVDDIDEQSTNKTNSIEEAIRIEKEPVIINGRRIEEELITFISNDTRTIDLLDRFEGYGDKDSPVYQRIVVKNVKYGSYASNGYVGFNLVIERSKKHDYTGDITFTEFKQGNDSDLRNHVKSEVSEDVIDKYVGTDRIYRFKTPYHLRAQNSSNRTGYGWEWDWSGGYGSYIEGTQYGETTDYVFVGVYITRGFFFNRNERKQYIDTSDHSKEKEVEHKDVLSIKNYQVQMYSGKLRDVTLSEYKPYYIRAYNGQEYKYLPVQIDDKNQKIYIAEPTYNRYKDHLMKGELEIVKTF